MEIKLENKMDNYDRFIAYLAGEMTDDEKSKFEVWLESSPERKKEFEEIRGIWEMTGDPSLNSEIDIDKGWDTLSNKLAKKNDLPVIPRSTDFNRKILYNFLKVAAVLVLAIILWKSFDNNEMLSISSLDSDNFIHTLPDGTTVSLKPWTTIEYPEHFEKGKREIFITGEASFEVVSDPGTSFVIQTGGARVEVLGTSFNLNAYEYNDQVEVEVQEGKVLFYNNLDPGNPLASKVGLGAGEKATYSKTTNSIVKSYNQNIWLLNP